MSFYGYGIDTSNTESFVLRPDAEDILWEKIRDIDWVKEDYAGFCDGIGLDPADSETYSDYMDEYEDNTLGTDNSGMNGLIADVINTERVDGPFYYRDSCIFVEATLPEDDDERESMITMKQIRELLTEFVGPLVSNKLRFEWLQIEE